MLNLPLELLQQHIDPALSGYVATLLKRSAVPSEVYRLTLTFAAPTNAPPTVIAKIIDPGWPGDAQGHAREARFYRELLPRLDIPQPRLYYAGPLSEYEQQVVIMEDVGDAQRFPPPQHAWSMAEIEPIMTTYARFHSSATTVLPALAERDWLMPRHETSVLATAAELPELVQELVSDGLWAPLPGFPDLVAQTLEQIEQYASAEVTLLHNDVFPPNAALPLFHDGQVMLMDWEMASWGLPEMDLSYMFLQPFRSHRRLRRPQVMSWYWGARSALGDAVPSPAQRLARQLYADQLWALWLIPVAHRAQHYPFPPLSFPRVYWDVMYFVLGERLQDLCQRIQD